MEAIDRLDGMLRRFAVSAEQFHLGPLCATQHFAAVPGRGFLHILRDGVLTVSDESAETMRVVTEPSLFFYPRPYEHTFYATAESGVDLACATLAFEGGSSHPLVAALPDCITVPTAEVPGLESSLDLLTSELDEFRCGHRHVIDRIFEIVLLKLLRYLLDHAHDGGDGGANHETPPGLLGGLADPQLARALSAMHEQPGAPWTLDTLARTANMSRSAFSARFRELVGASPHDYLISWRLTVGKQLLHRRYPVSQVAAELGYTSSSFSRVFMQREGVSPRVWVETAAA